MNGSYAKAVDYYKQMTTERIKPDRITITNLIWAAILADKPSSTIIDILQEIPKHRVAPDIDLFKTALKAFHGRGEVSNFQECYTLSKKYGLLWPGWFNRTYGSMMYQPVPQTIKK
jgi:hypothetical protein